jgi:predicted deacylase
MNARFTALAAGCLALTVGCGTSSTMTATTPLTRAERSRFEETSRYADVRAFIDALVKQTPRVHVEMFGESEEGRDLPLLVIGDPPAAAPLPRTDARLPVVFVMANIHAGEVEGKEAVLHLARRLTAGDLQPLLRSAVWLFAPIYNADGNERIGLDNRTEQYGPIGGVGTRENAKGLDLNRDFMKLESSEARALVSLFTRWDPDVIVDLHTTNGSYHGYHLTYAPQLNPNSDPTLSAYVRDRMLPTLRNAMASRHQWRTYDYGNFTTADAIEDELEGFAPGETRQKVWRTYDARPRFGNNYVGLRNRIAILSEAYSYLSFERRVKVTEAFVEEIMRFVSSTGSEIRSLTASADAESSAGLTEGGVAFALQALPGPVDVLVGAIGSETNPRSGKSMRTMIESVATPTSMTVYDGFGVTVTRPVPREYVLRPSADGLHQSIARLLRAHGIVVDELSASKRVPVDRFVVSEIRRSERLFQGHHETAIAGRFERRTIDVPAGSIVVRTNQPLARLVFYLLEPESNDGLTTWNFTDGALTPGIEHPVLKSVP